MTKTLLIIIGLACATIIAAGNSIKTEPPAQTQTFEEWLKKTEHVGQYRDLTILKNLPKEKIIVVRNDKCDESIKQAKEKAPNLPMGRLFDKNHDHIQNVLIKLGIPHTLIGKSELDKNDYSLDDKWIILFNCNVFEQHCCNRTHRQEQPPSIVAGQCYPSDSPCVRHDTKLSDKTIEKIGAFVENGGYLFTEDLNINEIFHQGPHSPRSALRSIILCPRYVQGKTIVVLPSPGTEKHPYLKYAFEFPVQPPDGNIEIKWKIDDESATIRIIGKREVTTLIMCPLLVKEKTPEGAVAVTFSVPNQEKSNPAGQVLHIMTHFDNQPSKTGEFALQNLLVNFLMDMAEKKK